MFMHAGFAMLETGCCRAKNASNVLMKNLVNVCCGTLGWWSIGWALAYGEQNGNGFIGTDGLFGFGFYTRDKASGVITPVECTSDGCQSTMLSWFFQWAFCTAGATIVSGAVAERVKSPTYAAFAFLMTSFIYPMVVASTWGGGWLASLFGVGYMDFAGSGLIFIELSRCKSFLSLHVFSWVCKYMCVYLYIYIYSKEVWKSNFRQYGEMKKQSAGRRVRREKIRRKKMQVREKVGKSRNTVFFRGFVAPEG